MDTGTFITVYNFILILIVTLALLLIAFIWRYRHIPGTFSLMTMIIGQVLWALFYFLHLVGFMHPSSEPFFWSKLAFIGIVMVPASYFLWTAIYTNNDRLVTNRLLVLLCIEPVVFNIVVWTDHWHGWFSGQYLATGRLGIAFTLHTLYSYALFFIAAVMQFVNWRHSQPLYRMQAFVVMMTLPIALIANLTTIFYSLPRYKVDLSPLGFVVTAVFFTYAHLRYQFFDILPVARHKVMDDIRDGVLVIDTEDRIIDMNPAAKNMLGLSITTSEGLMAQTVIPVWDQLTGKIDESEGTSIDFIIEKDGLRHINLIMSTIYNKFRKSTGRLLLLRDITEIKNIENDLRDTNRELLRKIEEIEALQAQLKEQVIRDPLTGLFNRRFLHDAFKREIIQAQRAHGLICLAIIDLDKFKNVNDTYGHDVGDQFLISFAQMLQEKMRKSDLVCRYGGEEFIIVMPGASLETATARINMLLEEFSSHKINTGGNEISISFSAGLAGYPFHGKDEKDIIAAADQALLKAKKEGRNRVAVAPADYSATGNE